MSLTYFCPRCFAVIGADEQRCPQCGDDLAEEQARPYQERLIQALGHPLAEARMTAITALGLRAEPVAAAALAACALAAPVDVIQGLAVIESLRRMPAGSERKAALMRLARHPAHAVASAAARELGDAT